MSPAGMSEWQRWHTAYGDPESDLSQRLAVVHERIRIWADLAPAGPLRLISACAGQAHDVIGGLGRHPRGREVSGVLVEWDEGNVAAAQRGLHEAGLTGVTAVVGDAARLEAYADAVPADLVLMCGVFGNISDEDVRRTVSALPMLCASGATVIWTRHRRAPDLTADICRWFESHGFARVDITSPGPGRFAVGTHRFAGRARPLRPDPQPLFTFR